MGGREDSEGKEPGSSAIQLFLSAECSVSRAGPAAAGTQLPLTGQLLGGEGGSSTELLLSRQVRSITALSGLDSEAGWQWLVSEAGWQWLVSEAGW